MALAVVVAATAQAWEAAGQALTVLVVVMALQTEAAVAVAVVVAVLVRRRAGTVAPASCAFGGMSKFKGFVWNTLLSVQGSCRISSWQTPSLSQVLPKNGSTSNALIHLKRLLLA